ncbi:hypothetical protein LTR84_003845 [Exophiala bonariae]|uniref:Uncharacterized protein n=1 Tax=Exophiala bonariae TaxID=1690606 RepID=A0AAV9N752_9EURO|nr:hypothetical protein LTR84_003845 [Exophiala bonariae]
MPRYSIAKDGRLNAVEYLIERGADVFERRRKSKATPLHIAPRAAMRYRQRTSQRFTEQHDNARTNTTIALLKILAPDYLEDPSTDSHSALTRTVFVGWEGFVKLLLTHNSQVNITVSDKIMFGIWWCEQLFHKEAEQLGLSFKQNFAPNPPAYSPGLNVDPEAEVNPPTLVLSVAVTLRKNAIVDLLLLHQKIVDFTIEEQGSALYFYLCKGI